jgi:hypothetical protein
MYITFQQGIITYPTTGPLQSFLAKTGVYVSFQATNGQTDIAFAHGSSNYLHTESVSVANAWGPIPASTDTWLYWDINLQSGVRTFGQTYLQPLYGADTPLSPVEDQHWFNTTVKKMYVYQSGGWREVVRVFAAMVNNAVFTPLGSGFASTPYAGTQVGLLNSVSAGRIIVDSVGAPIRRVNREFFTTESEFFANGSPVNTIRLEANVLTGTAQENLGAFQVVRFSGFGEISLATYDDIQTTMIAMLMESLSTNETGTVVVQGTVTNPAWNFTTPGAELWIDGSGVFTEIDPHVTDVITYPVGKPPVARVITPTTIFFDQGLGGKGDQGIAGTADVDLASTTTLGITKLSVSPVSAANPIAVGDNDPRNTNARVPLAHLQAATTITFTPYLTLTGATVQAALQELEDDKITVAEPVTQVVYGTGTGIDSSPTLTYNATTGAFTLDPGTVTTPGDIFIRGATKTTGAPVGNVIVRGGPAVNTSGGQVNIYGGATTGTAAAGGSVTIAGGTPAGTGAGGSVTLVGTGGSGTDQDGGPISITAGTATGTGTGGTIDLYAGGSVGGNGGNLLLRTGINGGIGSNIEFTTSNTLRMRLMASGALEVGGSEGLAGDALTSNGPGVAPTWQPVAGGGTPGGANTNIQFNDFGSFGGNTNFTYDQNTGGEFRVNTPDGGTQVDGGATPGNIRLFTAFASSGDTDGGNIYVLSGYGNNGGSGGDINIETGYNNNVGNTPTPGQGGDFSVFTGSGGASSITDGTAFSGRAGTINLSSGNTGDATVFDDVGGSNNAVVSAFGGDITITGGGGGTANILGALGNGNATASRGAKVHLKAGYGGNAFINANGTATAGAGGDIILEALQGGTATVGTGTAINGRPGNIVGITQGGHWVQQTGYWEYEQDSEAKAYVLRGETFGAMTVELFSNGPFGSPGLRMVLPYEIGNLVTNNMAWVFEVRVVGRSQSADEAAGYVLEGVIDHNGGSVAIIGAVQKTVLAESDPTWDANVFADNTNQALAVSVTGAVGSTIRWTAYARIVAVGQLEVPA